jgi:hypothetical protein
VESRVDAEAGATLIDLLVVAGLAATLTAISAPLSAEVVDASRARHASGFISARLRLARVDAVNRGVNVGLVFDHVNSRWQLRVCRDGTANGLRRAEIASGADPCIDGPHDFSALFPGVAIAVDASLVGPAGEPGSPDPVRLGSSDIASFSPDGGCTSGSVFLTSARGLQYAIRLAGTTGRLRIFRYDKGTGAWSQP